MNIPFEKIDNWPVEAKQGGYRVKRVALHLGVSVRWLEMYLKKRFGKRPRELFAKWRERVIRRLVAKGKTGKEILDEVHLAHCSSLSRSLLSHGKRGLRELRRSRTRYLGGGYSP
jgi:AraC-like DNA-binding protein